MAQATVGARMLLRLHVSAVVTQATAVITQATTIAWRPSCYNRDMWRCHNVTATEARGTSGGVAMLLWLQPERHLEGSKAQQHLTPPDVPEAAAIVHLHRPR